MKEEGPPPPVGSEHVHVRLLLESKCAIEIINTVARLPANADSGQLLVLIDLLQFEASITTGRPCGVAPMPSFRCPSHVVTSKEMLISSHSVFQWISNGFPMDFQLYIAAIAIYYSYLAIYYSYIALCRLQLRLGCRRLLDARRERLRAMADHDSPPVALRGCGVLRQPILRDLQQRGPLQQPFPY